MNKEVYTIVISYNKIEPTIKAIRSIFTSYKASKIILIDNSETEYYLKKIKGKLKEYQENILFIKNHTNLGFAKAVNQGIKVALKNGADYILLLNDDAYLDKDCVKNLINALENTPKAMLAGPTIFYHKKKVKFGIQVDFTTNSLEK